MLVTYEEYMMWRQMGLRAVTAYGIAKYGFDFLMSYLLDEEK